MEWGGLLEGGLLGGGADTCLPGSFPGGPLEDGEVAETADRSPPPSLWEGGVGTAVRKPEAAAILPVVSSSQPSRADSLDRQLRGHAKWKPLE